MITHPSIKHSKAEDLRPGNIVYVSGGKPLYKMTTGILLVVSSMSNPPDKRRRIIVLLSDGTTQTYNTSSCYVISYENNHS